MIKWWFNSLKDTIDEYNDKNKILLVEGWTHDSDVYGGFYSFCIFIFGMLLILPLLFILEILFLPILIVGKISLLICKIIKRLIK